LAERALGAFGRLDAWINNAAVSLFGRVEELPWAAYEQVLRTNLFGYIHGARAALPIFRAQGHGLLVNVASLGRGVHRAALHERVRGQQMGHPGLRRVPADGAARHARHPRLHRPARQHRHADISERRQLHEPGGSAHPARAAAGVGAEAVLDLYARPRREVFVGMVGRAAAAAHALAPGLLETLMAHQVERKHFQDRPAPPDPGNLFAPRHDAATGGWRPPADHQRILPPMALAASAAAALALVVLARRMPHGPGRRSGPYLVQ
jgi:NAD(P)-dependent dehydrogenase (short-subunit alcohol dehydrogenase family)